MDKFLIKRPLPNPQNESSLEKKKRMESVNKEVSATPTPAAKRKGKKNQHYSPELRAKIARYTVENGDARAVAFVKRTENIVINESTVRSMRAAYLKAGRPVDALPKGQRGQPLLLGSFDAEVKEYVFKLREAGGVVNRSIVLAAAKGILQFSKPSLLKINGGHIELERSWAASFMTRCGLVKRKGTKAAKHLPI